MEKVKLQFNQLLWGNHEELSSLFYYVTDGRKYSITDDRNPLKYGTYNKKGEFIAYGEETEVQDRDSSEE